jgi:hypothetical protein
VVEVDVIWAGPEHSVGIEVKVSAHWLPTQDLLGCLSDVVG